VAAARTAFVESSAVHFTGPTGGPLGMPLAVLLEELHPEATTSTTIIAGAIGRRAMRQHTIRHTPWILRHGAPNK